MFVKAGTFAEGFEPLVFGVRAYVSVFDNSVFHDRLDNEPL